METVQRYRWLCEFLHVEMRVLITMLFLTLFALDPSFCSRLESKELKMLRVSVSSFYDYLAVVLKTMQEFDTTVTDAFRTWFQTKTILLINLDFFNSLRRSRVTSFCFSSWSRCYIGAPLLPKPNHRWEGGNTQPLFQYWKKGRHLREGGHKRS